MKCITNQNVITLPTIISDPHFPQLNLIIAINVSDHKIKYGMMYNLSRQENCTFLSVTLNFWREYQLIPVTRVKISMGQKRFLVFLPTVRYEYCWRHLPVQSAARNIPVPRQSLAPRN